MKIFESQQALAWGSLDLPLFGVTEDWSGNKVKPPVGYSLAIDSENLWFVATRQATACVLPNAEADRFTPELWKADVSELFLADPQSGSYLEFNIAANGAWWASKFSAPRVPHGNQPDFISQVSSFSEADPSNWVCALSVPIRFLSDEISLGPQTTGNATFIQNSPDQIFLTAVKLPGGEPDFHQPSHFSRLSVTPIPET